MIRKIVKNENLNLVCAFISLTFCIMFFDMNTWGWFIGSLLSLIGFTWHWCTIIFEEADRDKTGE